MSLRVHLRHMNEFRIFIVIERANRFLKETNREIHEKSKRQLNSQVLHESEISELYLEIRQETC